MCLAAAAVLTTSAWAAGKDRTGLLAALLLSVLGAGREAVLDDYERSDAFHVVALAGLEENPKVTGLDRRAEISRLQLRCHACSWLCAAAAAACACSVAWLPRAGLQQMRVPLPLRLAAWARAAQGQV